MSATPQTAGKRRKRSELATVAVRLRNEGKTMAEIASALGISRSYASSLCNDPTGEGERQRKRSYGGTCEGCGARTDGSNGRSGAPRLCATCTKQTQHDERQWTPDTIVAALRAYADGMGRSPAATDAGMALAPSRTRRLSRERVEETVQARERGLRLPRPACVYREFGTWAAALEAAGLEPPPRGGAAHRDPTRRERPYEGVDHSRARRRRPLGRARPRRGVQRAARHRDVL